MKLNVEILKIDKLTPDPDNAKEHPQRQINQIKKSIKKFGMIDPIGIWGENNIVVEGHGRLLAIQELGYVECPVIRLPFKTKKEATEYAIIHNQTTMNSGFDIGKLKIQIKGLDINFMRDFEIFKTNYEKDDYNFDEINENDYSENFTLPDDGKPEICQMAFTLHEKQVAVIKRALELVIGKCKETYGNTNKNGNALFQVVREWEELKKLN